MKGKLKVTILPIVSILIILLSFSFIIYQNNKILRYKKDLSNVVKTNIEKFAGTSNDFSNEGLYAEKYGYLQSAQDAYITLKQGTGFPKEEYRSNLSMMLFNLKNLMLNDKEKVGKILTNTNVSELMFNIAGNFEDKESISKVFDLLEV